MACLLQRAVIAWHPRRVSHLICHLTTCAQEERRKFNTPISFWSDYAGKGSGTAMCSQRAQHLQARAHAGEGQAVDPACIGHRAIQRFGDEASGVSVRFPKDVTFSTPIASSLQPHKE